MSDSLNVYWQLGESLIQPCFEAADAINQIYNANRAVDVAIKADSTPVTEADHRSHDILLAHLQQLTPDWPVLSEEGKVADFEERSRWHTYWLVDPLDGTREFINRTGEFTVNVALIEQGKVVLGLLAVPPEGKVYLGVPGRGAVRVEHGETTVISAGTADRALLEVLSGAHRPKGQLADCIQFLRQQFGSVRARKIGSALKFARMAEGVGDIYPRFSRCCEWDTAAGHALLEAAGGGVVDLSFEALQYNQSESLISPHFIAVSDRTFDWQHLFSEFFC